MEQNTILYIEKRLEKNASVKPEAGLPLPYDLRQKSRQRVTLDNGEEVGLFLPRGSVLQNGDLLEAENGMVIEVKAAPEKISIAHTQDRNLMLRACYYLGSRHIPIQIGEEQISYLHDRILDEILVGLGLEVTTEKAPFEPECGAYDTDEHHHH